MDSSTPIQPILIGDSAKALRLSQMLRERGLLVTSHSPTDRAGRQCARLRVTLSAAHSEAQVQLLLNALAECYPQLEPNAPMRNRLYCCPAGAWVLPHWSRWRQPAAAGCSACR
ncbi:aminotransferase class I/II-fold pyridoxal phosphate-dependent enzyme [Pseudomonas peli]|uniref:aminotransferase class I/II-fold pyridoxal phosphate-dependent enzyme n=1 Tax=Pseudomonas peli TaxID=592361 RepID=UPI0024AE2D1B|nr:aminotransferase class I/II-fold pyridoxal phosphate-dependent enzyme [Pseudomonas peli]